jgi:arginase family enzyme
LRSSARRSTSSFSDRPGARFGPRAIRAASCPPGSHLEVAIDAFAALRIVDYGDAPVIPAEPLLSHEAVERLVGEVAGAGALPIVLGGDHSIAEPDVRAVAARHGAVGLVHFDTHTDTGSEVFGAERSHGTPMYRLVEDGHVDPRRYVQIGLRGYWPTEREFAWQAERGITSLFMHDVRARSGRRRARSGRWIPRAADRPRRRRRRRAWPGRQPHGRPRGGRPPSSRPARASPSRERVQGRERLHRR